MVCKNEEITKSCTQENTRDKQKDTIISVCHLKKTIWSNNTIKFSLSMLLLYRKQNNVHLQNGIRPGGETKQLEIIKKNKNN